MKNAEGSKISQSCRQSLRSTNNIHVLEMQCSQEALPGFSGFSRHCKIKKLLLFLVVFFKWFTLKTIKSLLSQVVDLKKKKKKIIASRMGGLHAIWYIKL